MRGDLTCVLRECVRGGVLVHCGAGVSRSASLCVAYLMRHHGWGVSKAHQHVLEKRKRVCINEGFWAMLVQLQKALGIDEPMYPLSSPFPQFS